MMKFMILLGLLACVPESKKIELMPVGSNGEPNFEMPEEGFAYLPMDLVLEELEAEKSFYILDARSPNDYAIDHISGAISVPFYEVGDHLDNFPVGDWIVAYCACPHSESGVVAEYFMENGHENVGIIDEGYLEWKAAGYPIE